VPAPQLPAGPEGIGILDHKSKVTDAAIEPGEMPGGLIGDHGVVKIGAGESSDGLL